jgi:hypothetical protein
MALWIMLKSFKMGSHRILLFVFFYFISHMRCIIFWKNIQTYPRIGLFEKMMYRRIRIRQILIHVSVSMLPRYCHLGPTFQKYPFDSYSVCAGS